MEEIKEKLDLILSSQVVTQTELIRLNSNIDALDEKVDRRINALDEKFEKKFDKLEETLEEDRKEIGSIFNDIFKRLSA